MNSRPEDVLRGDRQNRSINYLHVAVTESRTKTAIRTGFLLAHSSRMYSQFLKGSGWWLERRSTVRKQSGECTLKAYLPLFIFLFSLGALLECLH